MPKSVFTFDEVPFERRLAETIWWCSSRVRVDDPLQSLRSESIRPSLLERDRASAIRAVAGYRGNTSAVLPTISGHESLLGGRLLVYFPDADLTDGAAESVSGGFFDVHNVPPWDTWIALAEDSGSEPSYAQYVVSWVPQELVACAQEGIDVNPEECIVWLDDAAVAAREELRHLLR